MIANLVQSLRKTLRSVTESGLQSELETQFQSQLASGSQVLLAFQRLADQQVSDATPPQQLQAALTILAQTLEFPLVFVEHAERDQLRIVAAQGFTLPITHPTISISEQSVLSSTVISTQQPVLWAEEGNPLPLPQLEDIELFASRFQTIVSLPLVCHQQGVGVLTLAHPDYRPVDTAMLHWLSSLAAPIAKILDESYGEYELSRPLLQASEPQKLPTFSSDGIIYDLVLGTRTLFHSSGLAQLLGLTMVEIESSLDWWLAQIHPDDRFSIKAFWDEDVQLEREFTLLYRVQQADKQYQTVCDHGIVLRDALGTAERVVGTITTTALLDSATPLLTAAPQSIAPQPVAALPVAVLPAVALSTLTSAPAALPEATSLMIPPGYEQGDHSVLDSIPDIIFQTDRDGRWTFLNQAWTNLTGFPLPQTLGQLWQDFVHPEDSAAHQNLFHKILTGQDSSYSQALRILTQFGETRWVEVRAQPFLNGEQQVQGIVGTLRDITDRQLAEPQPVQDAMHDGLTRLPNRALFMDRLQHSFNQYQRTPEAGFAVLFLDLDRFKLINESLGHSAGDELLKDVAERIQHCLRPGDTIARFGGDVFTILLPTIVDTQTAAQVSDRILSELGKPFRLAGTEVYTSASIGIALSISPEQDPNELLRNADLALYRAKANGKNRHESFTPTLHIRALKQLELETDLRRAIERQELIIHYQPIHSLPSRQLAGFEALLRWEHPERGLLAPADFLDLATESNLAILMGNWVLKTACEQLQQWQMQYAFPKPIFIAINLFTHQVHAADFVQQVQNSLLAHGIEAHCLMLEVGETIFVGSNSENTLTKLRQLRNEGIQICLDEFGRRFSALSDLSQLPLTHLKLERNLVSDMGADDNLEMICSIIRLGHKLELQVMAEGVETEAQLAQLQAQKCEYGQGRFFALAAPPTEQHYLFAPQLLADSLSMGKNSSTPTLKIRGTTGHSQLSLDSGNAWSLGRSPDSAVVLLDRWVSRNHAEIQRLDNGDYYLVDLGSGNGSFVNGQRVSMPVRLKDGDLLTIGHTEIEFQHLGGSSITQIQSAAPKTILMLQASHRQGEIWREALTSQGLTVTPLEPDVDLQTFIEQRVRAEGALPDLLLLDMTTLRPNPYSFCRWCHSEYPQFKIILTSGTRTDVPPSERQWAIYQGAVDLLSAFPDDNLFANIVDISTKVRVLLNAIGAQPISQQSLASALMSIQSVIGRDTIIRTDGQATGDLR
jgi:diguanylate cyclase (GGDEF)-like protein/PAS domain S-box-containing protein